MEVTANSVPVKVEANNGSERPTKKNGKEEKSRRKDDKSVEQVMKALNVLETTEEKLAAMCKKYTEIVDENRKLQVTAKQWEKGLHAVLREKEQLQADHSKAVLTRSRLESLCRELQRQNKQIKEESVLKIREEEEKRKEVSAKFNATLAEITSLMTSSNEKTNLLRDENVEITKKFKSICDQNSIQQQQVDKMNTQRKLEAELTEARLAKQRLEFAGEKEILLKEKQGLYMDIHSLHARVNELEGSEASLKGQVSLYADRYDEFQTALTKSNEVFGGFKGEMEKMSKKITRLEKETSTWKGRWEKSHQSFLEVVAEKSKCEGELALASRKHAQLEKLCRTLQTERVLLLTQIKGLSLSPSTDETPVSCENMTEGETMQQTSCSAVHISHGDTLLAFDESSNEITSSLDNLNLQSSNSGNSEKPHSDTPDLTNIAQTAGDDTTNVEVVSVEKSPVLSSEDRSNDQDDVNALSVDKAPANHVDGESNSSNAVNGMNTGKPAADKQGGKPDARAASKKGVKPRPGVKEPQGDRKTKAPSAADVKKASCDASKEKKDKDNVRVLSGNKNKAEIPGDKKDKKDKGEVTDKNDQSLKEKTEIDSSNEKQRHGNDSPIDSNKIAELISEEKKDESKVQEESDGNLLTRKQDTESRVSDGSANTIPLVGNANLEKKENTETKLSKESNVALAPLVIETKGPDQPTDGIDPAKITELKKTGGETGKIPDEKYVGKQLIEVVGPSVKENDKKEVEAVNKMIEDKPSEVVHFKSELGVDTTRISESNKAVVTSACEAKNDECKVGEVDIGKKVESVVNASKTSLPPVNSQDKETGKSDITTAAKMSEDKMAVVSETNLSTKAPAIENVTQAKSAHKPTAPPPSKDVKKAKKPEKPKKSEKLQISAEEKVDKMSTEPAKPSLPETPTDKKEQESRSPSAAQIPAPTPSLATTPSPAPPPTLASTPSPAPTPTLASTPSPATTSTPFPFLATIPSSPLASAPSPSPTLTSALIPSPAPTPTPTSPLAPAPTFASVLSPALASSPTSPPTSTPMLPPPPAPASPGVIPNTPEATAASSSSPAQQPETGSSPKAETAASEVNPGSKQQSDSKKEKVVAKKRKK